MSPKPIPEGYNSLTPYLSVDDAAKAIDFYKSAFGAKERMRMEAPGGKIGHAEIEIGDSVLMLADPFDQSGSKTPKELGAVTSMLLLYSEDADATVKQAEAAGAKVTKPVEDMFWGDRSGRVVDPFGHEWMVATHTEDVPPEEMAKRAEKEMASLG